MDNLGKTPIVANHQSPEIDKIVGAICEWKAKNSALIVADAKNEVYKRNGKASKYASLSNILETVSKPLAEYGLATWFSSNQSINPDTICVTTYLGHTSGQWLSSTVELSPVPELREFKVKEYVNNKEQIKHSDFKFIQTPQAIGSVITYAKRYGLLGLLGLGTDEDDDGNTASAKEVPQKQATQNRSNTPPTPTQPQEYDPKVGVEREEAEGLYNALKKAGVTKVTNSKGDEIALETYKGIVFNYEKWQSVATNMRKNILTSFRVANTQLLQNPKTT